MRRTLFEKADAVSDRVRLPLALYGGGKFGPFQSRTITIGGASEGDIWSDIRLRDMIEDDIVDLALDIPGVMLNIAEQLGMRMPVWCLIRCPRRTLFPTSPNGKPGDFDVILGEIHGSQVSLDRLALLECKLGKLRSVDEIVKYASDRGTTQAIGGVALGFDQVLLLHFLVGDPAERTANQAPWADAADAANFAKQMERVHGALVSRNAEPAFGATVVGWGHVAGVNPAIAGAFSVVPMFPAPMLSRDRARDRRSELHANLRTLLPENRPARPFFRFCAKCGSSDLLATDVASIRVCARHR